MKVYKARRKRNHKLKRMLKKLGNLIGGTFTLIGVGIALKASYIAGMQKMADNFTAYAENELAENTAIGIALIIVGMLIMWCNSDSGKEV